MNPDGAFATLPLPAGDGEVTLFLAWSVFTHLLEADAAFYLRELARVLHPTASRSRPGSCSTSATSR